MPVADFNVLRVGSRVSYEDQANPRREGRIAEIVEPTGPAAIEYRVEWDDGGEATSDLRQHGWYLLAEMPGSIFDGAEILFAYTRDQALLDGTLVAVPADLAREAGFVWPVALTSALWNRVEPTDREREAGQSLNGRLWDVLMMATFAIRHVRDSKLADAPISQKTLGFRVSFYDLGRGRRGGRRTEVLRLETGPGDAGEPVVTIGYPSDF